MSTETVTSCTDTVTSCAERDGYFVCIQVLATRAHFPRANSHQMLTLFSLLVFKTLI